MGKKIFKIVGIMFASVIGFVGAFFGVMALMGKFDTPIVFPNRLEFVDSEQMIVYNESLEGDNEQWFSFTLNGFSDSGAQVNQKNCYVYFDKNTPKGAELITLYDKNKNLLSKDKNGYYAIECDEPVYYRVKRNISSSHFYAQPYGKVVLKAIDDKKQIRSNDLTIWVDRAVEEIRHATASVQGSTQRIQVQMENTVTFDYVVSPAHALNPISRNGYAGGKIVELYYVDKAEGNERYVFVDDSFIQKYNFLHKDDNGKYCFSSNVGGTYEFVMGVFESFEAKDIYLSNPSSATNDPIERLSNMVTKYLEIVVITDNISRAEMISDISIDLYADNYVSLLTAGMVDNVQSTPMGLQMYVNTSGGEQLTYNRFGNVQFGTTVYDYKTDVYFNGMRFNQAVQYDSTTHEYYVMHNGTDKYVIELSPYTIPAPDGSINTIVDSVTFDSQSYESDSNVVVLNTKDNGSEPPTYTLQRLISGSYLALLDKDETTGIHSPTVIDYEASLAHAGTGDCKDRMWKIVAKEEANNVYLCAIIVNDKGYTFTSSHITFNTQDMSAPQFYTTNAEVYVEYERHGTGDNIEYLPVYVGKDAVGVNGIAKQPVNVTYDACVFVTKQLPEGENYEIDVIKEVVFSNGPTNYVLVGYYDGLEFQNKVRAKEGATGATQQIYLVQLKNKYQQTAGSVIDNMLREHIELSFATDGAENIAFKYEGGVLKPVLSSVNEDNIQWAEDKKTFTYISGSDTYIYSFKGYSLTSGEIEVDEDLGLVKMFVLDNQSVDVSVVYKTDQKITAEYGDKITKGPNGQYIANEMTTGCVVWFKSENVRMLEDLSKAQLTIKYGRFIKVGDNTYSDTSYQDDLNKIDECTFDDEKKAIKVTFTTGEYPANDECVKISLMYKGESICDSVPLIIQSVSPKDIYAYDGTEIYELSQNDSLATYNSSAYIKIEIGYSLAAQAYAYTYSLYNSDTLVDTFTDESKNIGEVLTNRGWFLVDPDLEGVDHLLEVSSYSPNLFTVTEDAGSYRLEVLKTGTGLMKLASQSVARYIKVEIVADGFAFNLVDGPAGPGAAGFIISNYYTYTYGETAVSNQYVSATFGANSSSGSGNVEILEDETSGNRYLMPVGETDPAKHIAKLEFDGTDWVLTRNDDYINYTVNVHLVLTTMTKVDSLNKYLTFTSNVGVDYNNSWSAGNKVIYADTKVLLAVVKSSLDDNSNDAHEPMYIINNHNNSDIKIELAGLTPDPTELSEGRYVYSFAAFTPSEMTITITVGSYTYTDKIIIKPNAVITSYKDTLYSGEKYGYAELFTAQSFDESKIYGKFEGTKISRYKNGDKYENLVSDKANKLYVYPVDNMIADNTNNTLTAGWIKTVGHNIKASYRVSMGSEESDTYRYVSDTITVDIINSFSTESTERAIMAKAAAYVVDLVDYDIETDSFVLASVTSSDANLKAEAGNLLYDAYVSAQETIKGVQLTFKWKKGAVEHDVVWTGTIVVDPYTPEQRGLYNEDTNDDGYRIFSEMNGVDMLSTLFVSSIDDTIIRDITMTSSDEGIVDFSKYSPSLSEVKANIGKISGAYQDVIITVTITYTDYQTYTYDIVVTIENRQEITFTHPYSDLSIATNYYVEDEEEGVLLESVLGIQPADSGWYNDSTPRRYEPILAGSTVDFASDEFLTKRVNIRDKVAKEDVVNGIDSITLVGKSKNNAGYTISVVGSEVKFNADINGGSVTMILKIVTTSGAYDYYFVHVYNLAGLGISTPIIGEDYTATGAETKYVNTDSTDITKSALFNGMNLTDVLKGFNNNVNKYHDATISIYLIRAYTLTGAVVAQDDWYTRIEGKNIPTSTEYIALELAFLYTSSAARYYVGGMIINIRPAINEGDTLLSKYEYKESGHKTGEYTSEWTLREIDNNSNKIDLILNVGGYDRSEITILDIPGANGYRIDGNIIKKGDEPIVTTSGHEINILAYPTEGLSFIAQYQYTYGGDMVFAINVYYTLVEFSYDKNVYEHDSLGSVFDDDNFNFNNTVTLATILSNGNTSLSVDYPLDKVTIKYHRSNDLITENKLSTLSFSESVTGCSYNNSVGTFTFKQEAKTYYVAISIQLNKLLNTPIKYAIITVYPNIEIQESEYAATTSNKAVSATDVSYDYNQDTGSKLRITSEYKSGLTAYTIAGITAYVDDETDIETWVAAEYLPYFTNDADVYEVSGNTTYWMLNTVGGYINLAHMCEEVAVPFIVKFKYKDSEYYTEGSNVITRTLYVKPAVTFKGIEAKYRVEGANYETLYAGSTIPDYLASLFADTDSGAGVWRKIAVISADPASLDDNILDYDPAALGFTNTESINYVTVSLPNDNAFAWEAGTNQTELSVMGGKHIMNTKVTLTFNDEKNALTYNYYIMPDEINWLDYNEKNDSIVHDYTDTTLTADNQYVSIMTPGDTGNIYTSEELVLASLLNTENDLIKLKSYNNKEYLSDGGTRNESNTNVTHTPEGRDWVWTIEHNYTYVIRYNLDTDTISLQIMRTVSSTHDSAILTLELQLEGGEVREFTIAIFNVTVEGAYEDTAEAIFARDDYELDKKSTNGNQRITVKKNNTSSAGTLGDLSYELICGYDYSYYEGNGGRTEINSNVNALFKLDGNTMTLYAVGQEIDAQLTFKVKYNIEGEDYWLGNVVYKFTALPNYQFYLDDKKFVSEAATVDYELEDDVVHLTRDYDDTKPTNERSTFRYTLDLKELGVNIKTIKDKVLDLDQVGLKMQFDVTAMESVADIRNNGTEMYLKVGTDSVYWPLVATINGLQIIFHRDYTGELTLVLSIEHNTLGVYQTKLIVNVTGYIDIKYNGGTIPVVTTADSTPKSSGVYDTVMSASGSTPLRMNWQKDEEHGSTNKEFANFRNRVEIDYIMTNDPPENTQPGLDWANATSMPSAQYEWAERSNEMKILLPSVPLNEQQYVTFRISMIYYDYTAGDEGKIYSVIYYYVTYWLKNESNVSVYGSSEIKVDPGADTRINSDGQLTLFYYEERYEDVNNNYRFVKYYAGSKIMLRIEEPDGAGGWVPSSTYGDLTQESGNVFGNGGQKIEFSSDSNGIKLNKIGIDGDLNNVNNVYKLDNLTYKDSYFSTQANSIEAFAGLINSIRFVRFANMVGYNTEYDEGVSGSGEKIYPYYDDTTKTLYFKLVDFGNGAYGIKLKVDEDITVPETKHIKTGVLFNNRFSATMQLVAEDVIKEISDFALTTANAITAKNTILLDTFILSNWLYNGDKKLSATAAKEWLGKGIIGIGAPSDEWVNGTITKTEPQSTGIIICVPGGQEFEIYEVTYSYEDGEDLIYNLIETFYCIIGINGSVGASEIVVPTYGGKNSDCYEIDKKPDGRYYIDLSEGLTRYYNADGITCATVESSQFTIDNLPIFSSGANTYQLFKLEGKTTIILDTDKFDEFKQDPNIELLDVYTFTCDFTVGSTIIEVDFKWYPVQ